MSEKRRFEEDALQHLAMSTIDEARASMESLKLTSRIKTIAKNRILKNDSVFKSDLKLASICEERFAEKDTSKLSISELWNRLAEKQSDLKVKQESLIFPKSGSLKKFKEDKKRSSYSNPYT